MLYQIDYDGLSQCHEILSMKKVFVLAYVQLKQAHSDNCHVRNLGYPTTDPTGMSLFSSNSGLMLGEALVAGVLGK